MCLTEDVGDTSLKDLPPNTHLRGIVDNHRVTTLKVNDEEDDKAAPSIIVRVHAAMDNTMMRMVAEGRRL